MKKIVLSLISLAVLAVSPRAIAQNLAVPAELQPHTTIKVYLTVEKETVRTGPYARYAQKYLGTMAPLADRETYTIKHARMDYADPNHDVSEGAVKVASGEKMLSHVSGGSDFTRATPDRVSNYDKSTEEMARDAANVIFNIRKQRLDILTSDVADLYAGGLGATFEEMSRMEDEYLALFLGKHSVSTTVYELDVIPTPDKTNFIVCRFAEDAGVLPEGDLSGQPVVLAIAPDRGSVAPTGSKNAKNVYRVAVLSDCKVSYGQRQLASKRLPVFQYGPSVAM